MPGVIVIGAQWGDEGKGKVVDVFSAEADLVVRYQGGANAGHTLTVDGEKTVLHLVPSGVLHAGTKCLIGAGVALDVEKLVAEIETLQKLGHLSDPAQLMIADAATILLPYHRALDVAREESMGAEKLGTTGKGIGPAYEDRASRKAILFADLFAKEPNLREKLTAALKEKNFLLEHLYQKPPIDIETVMADLKAQAEFLKAYRCGDASLVVHKSLKAGKKVLFEGAQGTLLDIFHGTYPFVTSSSTIAGSALVGTGVGPTAISKVVAITKAYTTRVGSGPFPTELDDDIGQHLQTVGNEFGATTGRKRRCGWLDLVALKYAIRINGITNIALMKLDVLSGLNEIKVCTAYRIDGAQTTNFPVAPGDLARAEPVYESLPGWKDQIDHVKSVKELPRHAQDYIHRVGQELGIPVDVVSVGPNRNQTLWIKPIF